MLLSYSLGDAIDWKLKLLRLLMANYQVIPYSLGDAIDWKRLLFDCFKLLVCPLLARGRDRLETRGELRLVGYGDSSPLLARGRDRLETLVNASGLP